MNQNVAQSAGSRAKQDYCQASTTRVLLVLNALIKRDEDIKAYKFRD